MESISNLRMKVDELIKEVRQIKKDNINFQKNIEAMITMGVANNTITTNTILAKLDILSNLPSNIDDGAKSTSKPKRTMITSTFFKQELKSDMNKYIDILYTKDDIDNLKKDPEVLKKKTESDKNIKLISLIYMNIIKPNPQLLKKLEEFKEIYISSN